MVEVTINIGYTLREYLLNRPLFAGKCFSKIKVDHSLQSLQGIVDHLKKEEAAIEELFFKALDSPKVPTMVQFL